MAITYAELKEEAKLFYGELSSEQREEACELMKELQVDYDYDDIDDEGDDNDNEGLEAWAEDPQRRKILKVSRLREVLRCKALVRRFGRETVAQIYQGLQQLLDLPPTLQYKEEGRPRRRHRPRPARCHVARDDCLAVFYYLWVHVHRTCHSCGHAVLPGLGYSCSACARAGGSGTGGRPPNEKQFVLCADCFSADAPYLPQLHPDHPSSYIIRDFFFATTVAPAVATTAAAAATTKAAAAAATNTKELIDMKQCKVCGDFHKATAQGFMGDHHMVRVQRGGSGEGEGVVCEWCFSYFCFKCGKSFRDSTKRAEPGKWLQRLMCPSCSTQPLQSTPDLYATILKRFPIMLRDNELLKNCHTCNIKCKRGTLFWTSDGDNVLSSKGSSKSTTREGPIPMQPQPPPQAQQQPLLKPTMEQHVNELLQAKVVADMNAAIALQHEVACANSKVLAQLHAYNPQPPPYPPFGTPIIHGVSKPNAMGTVMSGLKVMNNVVDVVDKVSNVIDVVDRVSNGLGGLGLGGIAGLGGLAFGI